MVHYPQGPVANSTAAARSETLAKLVVASGPSFGDGVIPSIEEVIESGEDISIVELEKLSETIDSVSMKQGQRVLM